MRTTVEQGTFRFSDNNPHSGVEYARSRYEDLPEFVMAVIDDRIGVVGAGLGSARGGRGGLRARPA